MPPIASLTVRLGIPGLALLVLTLVLVGVQRTLRDARLTRRFALGVALWLGYSASLALSGFLARADLAPLPMLLIFVPMLALSLGLGLSPLGKALATEAPLAWLVGIHAFRFPLELVMHQAARESTMPPQMTFTGLNFDILSGTGAMLLGISLARGPVPRWLIVGWNALGSMLLAAIMAIAVASLPHFHAFGTEPWRLNTWVSYFPFIWLPAGLVASALFGHVLLWRRLLERSARTDQSERTLASGTPATIVGGRS